MHPNKEEDRQNYQMLMEGKKDLLVKPESKLGEHGSRDR